MPGTELDLFRVLGMLSILFWSGEMCAVDADPMLSTELPQSTFSRPAVLEETQRLLDAVVENVVSEWAEGVSEVLKLRGALTSAEKLEGETEAEKESKQPRRRGGRRQRAKRQRARKCSEADNHDSMLERRVHCVQETEVRQAATDELRGLSSVLIQLLQWAPGKRALLDSVVQNEWLIATSLRNEVDAAAGAWFDQNRMTIAKDSEKANRAWFLERLQESDVVRCAFARFPLYTLLNYFSVAKGSRISARDLRFKIESRPCLDRYGDEIEDGLWE